MSTEGLFTDRKAQIANLQHSRHFVLGIPIVEEGEEREILFEVRGAISQPGDVCLPGGSVDDGEDLEEALRREIREELLVSDEQIEVIGPSDILISDWGRAIHPYLVKLKGYRGTYSTDEVAEVFRMPLSYFITNEPRAYTISVREEPDEGFPYERISGGRNYQWHAGKREVYFYDYEKHTIWGLTAKIMKRFAEIVRGV